MMTPWCRMATAQSYLLCATLRPGIIDDAVVRDGYGASVGGAFAGYITNGRLGLAIILSRYWAGSGP